jgi:hypothetical protein
MENEVLILHSIGSKSNHSWNCELVVPRYAKYMYGSNLFWLPAFLFKQKLQLQTGLGYNDGVLLRKASPEETTTWSPRCISSGA